MSDDVTFHKETCLHCAIGAVITAWNVHHRGTEEVNAKPTLDALARICAEIIAQAPEHLRLTVLTDVVDQMARGAGLQVGSCTMVHGDEPEAQPVDAEIAGTKH